MNRLLFFLLIFVFVGSCKDTKNLSKNASSISSKQLQKNMEAANFDFEYFSGKAKVNFNDGSNSQSFTANIRIKNKQTIWLSLTGPFGIEGARILMEPNRIQILDKINGKYYDEKFDYLNQYLPIEVDFEFFQNLLIGNSFKSSFEKQKPSVEEQKYFIEDQLYGMPANFTINSDFRFEKISLPKVGDAGKLNLSFADYRFVENQLFAMIRELDFIDKSNKLTLDLNFNKIKKESSLDFPFTVPERFKSE